MERKINEIFKFRNKWYKTLESSDLTCANCVFTRDEGCGQQGSGYCCAGNRLDKTSVYFVEVPAPTIDDEVPISLKDGEYKYSCESELLLLTLF